MKKFLLFIPIFANIQLAQSFLKKTIIKKQTLVRSVKLTKEEINWKLI
jgi:hypothetical protein